MQADLSIDCDLARFLEAKTVAFLMIAVYPLGIPLTYACLLFCFRRLVNPLGCDELTAMRIRRELKDTNPRLRAIEFLFSCYRPGAYGFEVFESVRRIAMTGLIRYVAKTSGPPVAGILLSLVSIIVFREISPYENPSTNALSTFAQVESNEVSQNRLHLFSEPVCAVATALDLHVGLRSSDRAQLGAREQACSRRDIAVSRARRVRRACVAGGYIKPRVDCCVWIDGGYVGVWRTSSRFSSRSTSKCERAIGKSNSRSLSRRARCANASWCTNKNRCESFVRGGKTNNDPS